MRLVKILLPALVLYSASHATVKIVFVETGTDVVANYSGSLDITDFSDQGSGGSGSTVKALLSKFVNIFDSTNFLVDNAFSSVPQSFGRGESFHPDSASGSTFAVMPDIFDGVLILEENYSSGDPIAGTMTFNNTDFATMGIDADNGPYVWTLSNAPADTITMSFVPEPSAYTAILGLVGLGFAITRRR
jgi:hypothetical protein